MIAILNKIPGWHCNVDTTFGLVDANSLSFKTLLKGAIMGLNEYLRHLGVDYRKIRS